MNLYPIRGIEAIPLEEASKIQHLKRPGVYCIVSPSYKKYIGQSVNMRKRIMQYLNGQGVGQRKLYNSFRKYGIENHRFCVLEFCEESEMDGIEKFYISFYRCTDELNLQGGGANGRASEETKEKMRGPRPHARGRIKSEEERQKISEALKLLTAEKKAEINEKQRLKKLGKKHSIETKLRMSEARRGKPKSETWKQNIGNAHKGMKRPKHVGEIVGALRAKPVIQFDHAGNFIKEYSSASQAKRETGITAISHACTGLYKQAGGFIWKYKNDTK
jgi:group I intron endonuclease